MSSLYGYLPPGFISPVPTCPVEHGFQNMSPIVKRHMTRYMAIGGVEIHRLNRFPIVFSISAWHASLRIEVRYGEAKLARNYSWPYFDRYCRKYLPEVNPMMILMEDMENEIRQTLEQEL